MISLIFWEMDPNSQLKFLPYTGELNLEARLWWHIMSILRWSKCTSIPETLKSLLMNSPGCSCHCQKKNIIHLCIFTNPLFAIFPGNNLKCIFLQVQNFNYSLYPQTYWFCIFLYYLDSWMSFFLLFQEIDFLFSG